MLISKKVSSQEYPLVLEIWEKSVRATHHFLTEDDLNFYKEILPKNLDYVDLLLWYSADTPVGFSGTQQQELAMLFLDPDFIGKRYGHEILSWLIENAGITKIDVNAQNTHAKAFYLKHGFEVESKDAIDGFGKAYPIDHLVKI